MEYGDEYSAGQTPIEPPKRSWRAPILIAGAVAVVLLAGGAAYWFVALRQTKAPEIATTTPTTAQVQPSVPDDTSAQGSSLQYVSNGKDLNLSFTYPAGWTVSPPSNSNQADQQIIVTSPLVSMVSASNQSATGRVVVSIRPGTAALSELAGDKATAGQASSQIAYSKPTSSQHQYPYLTFIHLSGGTNSAGAFEEVMITGVTSFAKDQAVTSLSLSQLDPIISARFYTCSDQTCTAANSAALSITNSTWLNNSATSQTLAMFQSIQIN